MILKQQKDYAFFQQHILLLIALSLGPGLVYVFFGWNFHVERPAIIWYCFFIVVSLFGWHIYYTFKHTEMNPAQLRRWYKKLSWYMYISFSLWTVIFIFYSQETESNLHYIAIFTQLGASVIASTLLVSDKRLYIPILLTLMLPLYIYFVELHAWYGYVLALFSIIFMFVLLYAASNTNKLLKENYFHAHHDALTGLYNRKHFTEYMTSLSKRLKTHSTVAYVSLIDLDHFKTINDSLGHNLGDKLLIEVSQRLRQATDGTHIVSRLGGDEFILVSYELIDRGESDKNALRFANQLLKIMSEPYSIEKHTLHISGSIGICKVDTDSMCLENNFIKEADIAMYEAKAKGRDAVVFFNKELSDRVERHLLIEQKIYIALREKKMNMFYQPQFDKELGVIGCEALIRWHDEELGNIAPDEFIAIAEQSGQILALGSFVLEETFKTLYEWNAKQWWLYSFSINISVRQFISDSFVEEVTGLMKRYFTYKHPKQKIIFELTENVFAEDMDRVILVMEKMKRLGISFSLDDFGTGYSSLSYLKALPVEEIKIDKSFVDTLGEDENALLMIKTIISIAKNFKFSIVAEGVETKKQFELLVENGCDIYQGYYFDKALPKRAFEKKYLSTLPLISKD